MVSVVFCIMYHPYNKRTRMSNGLTVKSRYNKALSGEFVFTLLPAHRNTIAKRQIQCLKNQDMLSKKLDHVIALLSPTQHLTGLTARPPVPAIPPVHAVPPVPAISPVPIVPPVISPSVDLFCLKGLSKSRANFTVLLMKALFELGELEGKKHCWGSGEGAS